MDNIKVLTCNVGTVDQQFKILSSLDPFVSCREAQVSHCVINEITN